MLSFQHSLKFQCVKNVLKVGQVTILKKIFLRSVWYIKLKFYKYNILFKINNSLCSKNDKQIKAQLKLFNLKWDNPFMLQILMC